MTTSHRRRTSISRLVAWSATVITAAAMTACGSSSADDVPASPQIATSTAPVSTAALMPTSTVPATTVAEPPSTSAPPRPSGTRDELVRIGGGRLHIHCSGSGPSTVVLIAGWNDDRTSFDTIEPALAASTRVCSYDKFGTGSSDPAPRAQRFTTQANDLHELLRLTHESGPYVVVGHSFGGDVAVAFASKFRDEVHGLLLLDATPATWNTVLCSVADDGTPAASALVQLCAAQATAGDNVEGLDGPAAFAEIADISSLGALPTIVETAADRHYAEQGLSAELVARLTEAWNEGQQHWVSLSSHSAFVEVPDSGHYIQRDQPDLVVEQVTSLIA